MPHISQTNAVANFQCLGAECEDTCCVGWGMQVASETVAKYRTHATALLDAIVSEDSGFVMKRDPVTDFCVKFDHGLCGIHRDYGADFLGDACHFFPRVTRALGEDVFVTAALSCPEAARLMLLGGDPFAVTPRAEIRVPFSLKQYLPDGISASDAFEIHQRFIAEAANPEFSAEINLLRGVSVAHSLGVQPVSQWSGASAFYFRMAAARIPAAEPIPEDIFNLTHALHGLMTAGNAQKRTRLAAIRDSMAEALGITFDGGTIATAEDAPARALKLLHRWRTEREQAMQPILTRYLQAQLSAALFPFAGLGDTLADRMTIIGVRFATVKLALMAVESVDEPAIIRIVQPLSRFLDHLADPALSLSIYAETGWSREPRLRALLGA